MGAMMEGITTPLSIFQPDWALARRGGGRCNGLVLEMAGTS